MSIVDGLEPLLCGTGDIALGKRVGMPAWEIRMLKEHCDEEGLVLIIRASNPESRKYMYKRGYVAKPVGVSAKTSVTSNGPSGVILAKHIKLKERAGIASQDLGAYIANKNLYSDYDLMSAWKIVPGGLKKINTNPDPASESDFIYELNSDVGLRFMHGGNDDYYDPKTGVFKGVNTVDGNQAFVVIGAYDVPFYMRGMFNLKTYYERRKCFSDLTFKFQSGRVAMVVWPYGNSFDQPARSSK